MNRIKMLIEEQCDNMATGSQCRDFLRNDEDGSEPLLRELLRELLRLNLEQFCRRFDPAAMQQIGDLEKDLRHTQIDRDTYKQGMANVIIERDAWKSTADKLRSERDNLFKERNAAERSRSDTIVLYDEAIRVRNEAIGENNDMRLQRDEAIRQLNAEISARQRMHGERDEADRRAGAAERKLEGVQDTMNRTDEWFRQAKRDWSVEQNFSFDIVWERALHAKNNSERLDKLRRLCGYVENGSDTVVKLQQDDATREWILNVDKKSYYATSFFQVIDMAVVEED